MFSVYFSLFIFNKTTCSWADMGRASALVALNWAMLIFCDCQICRRPFTSNLDSQFRLTGDRIRLTSNDRDVISPGGSMDSEGVVRAVLLRPLVAAANTRFLMSEKLDSGTLFVMSDSFLILFAETTICFYY